MQTLNSEQTKYAIPVRGTSSALSLYHVTVAVGTLKGGAHFNVAESPAITYRSWGCSLNCMSIPGNSNIVGLSTGMKYLHNY